MEQQLPTPATLKLSILLSPEASKDVRVSRRKDHIQNFIHIEDEDSLDIEMRAIKEPRICLLLDSVAASKKEGFSLHKKIP
jgi:hypothetical protein